MIASDYVAEMTEEIAAWKRRCGELEEQLRKAEAELEDLRYELGARMLEDAHVPESWLRAPATLHNHRIVSDPNMPPGTWVLSDYAAPAAHTTLTTSSKISPVGSTIVVK